MFLFAAFCHFWGEQLYAFFVRLLLFFVSWKPKSIRGVQRILPGGGWKVPYRPQPPIFAFYRGGKEFTWGDKEIMMIDRVCYTYM